MKKMIISVLLVVMGLSSFFIFSGVFSKPELYQSTIDVLNDKQANVMALTAASAAASTALSAIPGDAGTPIASQISEISTYLFGVTCIIFLEKYMLTVIGYIIFKIIFPIACGLGIVYLMSDRISLRNIAIKLSVASLMCLSIVPLSVSLTKLIEDTNHIDISQVEVENEKEEGGWSSFFNKIVENTTQLPEKAKDTMVKLVDDIAVVLITSCVIPVIVMVSYFFIIKGVMNYDMSETRRIEHKRR